MAIDNLVNSMYAANLRIGDAMNCLEPREQKILTSYAEYATDKSKAVAAFLNNFYFRLPGGFFIEFISRAIELRKKTGGDVLLKIERLREYKKVAEDVRESLLDADLSLEECTKMADLNPTEQLKYIFDNQNFYRLMPIMLEGYITLRNKGYKREELTS